MLYVAIAGDVAISGIAARGWIATRDTLEAAGWLHPDPATRAPEPFTMVHCLNDTTGVAPSLMSLDVQDVLLGWRARPGRHRDSSSTTRATLQAPLRAAVNSVWWAARHSRMARSSSPPIRTQRKLSFW